MRYFIDTDIAEKYNLDDRKMNVYFGLCRLTYKQPWKRNDHEFARLFRFKSVSTVRRYINELITIGLIDVLEDGLLVVHHEPTVVHHEPTVVHHEPSVVHHEPKSKEERTKEENINNKKSLPAIIACDKPSDDGWLAGFNLFWSNFNPSKEFIRRKNACLQIWQKMPQDWRTLATERAAEHSPERNNPLFFLRDEDFLQTPSADAPQEKDEPKNWNGLDLESGVEYVTAKYKGRWGTYTKADADKFALPTKS